MCAALFDSLFHTWFHTLFGALFDTLLDTLFHTLFGTLFDNTVFDNTLFGTLPDNTLCVTLCAAGDVSVGDQGGPQAKGEGRQNCVKVGSFEGEQYFVSPLAVVDTWL